MFTFSFFFPAKTGGGPKQAAQQAEHHLSGDVTTLWTRQSFHNCSQRLEQLQPVLSLGSQWFDDDDDDDDGDNDSSGDDDDGGSGDDNNDGDVDQEEGVPGYAALENHLNHLSKSVLQ